MFKQFWSSGKDYFGTKPVTPLAPTSSDILQHAISSNLANFDGASTLVNKTNASNQSMLTDALRKAIPGYDDIVSKISRNITSELNGEIPGDVQGAIQRNAAAKALGGGYAGSGMHGNLLARDLGLTSLDLTQKGLDSAERWVATSRTYRMPQMMDLRSMFVSPEQQFTVDMNKFLRDFTAAKIEAAPDPAKRGRADQEMALFATIMSAVGGMSGGGGGGGGGNVQWQGQSQQSYAQPTSFQSQPINSPSMWGGY